MGAIAPSKPNLVGINVVTGDDLTVSIPVETKDLDKVKLIETLLGLIQRQYSNALTNVPPYLIEIPKGDALKISSQSQNFTYIALWFLGMQGCLNSGYSKTPFFKRLDVKALERPGEIMHTAYELTKKLYELAEKLDETDCLPYEKLIYHWAALFQEGMTEAMQNIRRESGKRKLADEICKKAKDLKTLFTSGIDPSDFSEKEYRWLILVRDMGRTPEKETQLIKGKRKAVRDAFEAYRQAIRWWGSYLRNDSPEDLKCEYSEGEYLVVLEGGRRKTRY
ncbi:hypothetical protein [Leptolyngbya sp. FACHB-8]|uniref:hypothetical protein n=1 Tax=unclassified Leptolyngbya TaxID=2650499 RepID=UPI001689BE48|nr:hypothetical protein [Leptolyngbya sp. FACHB-8]MBD1910279.1 hypothetical protein [Leptolyngbya sp. FACHB-8]